jgi:predicted metalloprotease with PDZ domain
MVTPRDVLGDLRRTMDDRPAPERVGACAASSSARSQEEYRRGARYAALTDTAIQKASSGQRGIDDLIRDLLARARAEDRRAFPLGVWRDAVQRELGDAGSATFDRVITRGEAVDLPDDAFGPCFHRASREEEMFELGFDRRSLAGTPAVVSGVTRGSAADKAGLRDGALVIASRIPADAAAAHKGGKKIRYRPWAKRQVVDWEARPCEKRR